MTNTLPGSRVLTTLTGAEIVEVATSGSLSGLTTTQAIGNLAHPAQPINAQTGTTYTLLSSDNNKTVTCSNAAAITVTVPAGLGSGFFCTVVQIGAGQVSFAASGTTVNSYSALTSIAGQYGAASLVAYSANVFALVGNLA